ncbi:diaminopimelate decarboxylase [Pseudoalteromonas sp. MSK9-3]|uniref:PLP-dependent decarboxylase n=1 Tax=Pseudoalteromonas sp. MSK9-3 TaxID=1897633 RepID=UPI000E6C785E|nr:PLP-dependent decarboxylase [Pseudoalteromonas sp. MSK9-3]RJE77793.1 diaminopimelate decarboxylase [Pseudoalteromonas sp. MSK9-3]
MSFLSTPLRQTITELTEQEHTPFFVYDLDGLLSHLKPLTEQSVVKLWYAVKANPLSKVIQTIDKAGFDFDVASSGELDQVLRQDIDASRVLNTGPAKSKRQIQHFLSQGVRTFVAESHNQVQWLNEAATEHDIQLRILLRVQLRWPEGEKNPLGGDSLTPFGLGTEQWQSLQLDTYPALNFVGLHIFQWGNMLCTEKLAQLWTQMVPPLKALAEDLGFTLEILDLGGGLGIPYSENDDQLTWSALIDALAQIKASAGVTELWMELGRYAVGEFGHYANPVVEQKQNYNEHQLIVSGGINHLLRPAVTTQAFPCTLLRNSSAITHSYLIHGPLCTALDHLGRHTLPSDVNEQDWLVFSQCGAYGFTESMPYFLCHELPAEYVIEHGEVSQVRAMQNASDYLR